MQRRNLLIGSLALPLSALALPELARSSPAREPGISGAAPASDVTGAIANFARLSLADLPADVVHAARRYLVDAIGCALAGWNTDKGRLAAAAMTAQGGTPEASILGSREQPLAAGSAAFANAELLNALDYDALPHTPPVTLPALLAVAEAEKLPGARLLAAVVAAHEVANRLQWASSNMISTLLETGETPDVFGINTEAILATAAALGGMTGNDHEVIRHAIGLAGYYCPPQGAHSWETLSLKTHVKYTPVGWVCQGAVTAWQLARRGFTSDPDIFDHESGFARFYGYERWEPEVAVGGMGVDWTILNTDFKAHAACRFTHSQIDCMQALVARHGFAPTDVVSIETLGLPFVANPEPYNVRTQEGAQFSTPYVIALAVHGIPLDARAYSPAHLDDPAIRATMDLITLGIHPDTNDVRRNDMNASPARVTVTLRDGTELREDVRYPIGTGALPDFRLSDAALSDKFLDNAGQVLATERAADLLTALWSFDKAADVAAVMQLARG